LAFTPDSKFLVIGSDLLTPVLDAATGKKMKTLPVGGVLAASADANLLAAGAPDDKRVIWDVAAARARSVLQVGPGFGGVAFSRDGKTLLTWVRHDVTESDDIRLWDLDTSRVRLTLKFNGWLRCAVFSPDGRTLATGQQFGAVRLWDPTSGRQQMILQQREGATTDALTVAFSNDGKLLAAGNSVGIVRLWDVETGQLKVSFKGHSDAIQSVAFSPDDKSLLSGSADRTARLWDVVTGQEVLALKGHKFPVDLVAFAADGKRLATAGQKEVKLWLAATEPEATALRVELDPDEADSPRAMNKWGDRLQEIHRPQEAENAYRKALARLEKLAAALPDIPDYRREMAYSLSSVAVMPSPTDPAPTAEHAHGRARQVCQTLPPDQKLSLAGALHRRGHARADLRQWHEAFADYGEAIELAPDVLLMRTCRATDYAEIEEWSKAAEDLAAVLESPDADDEAMYEYALLCLQLGQKESYQNACTRMLERFGQSAGTRAAFWAVWTSVLGPDAVADWTTPLRLAETAHADGGTSYENLNNLGAVLYRAGRFQEASRRLAEADAAFKQPATVRSTIACNGFFQAMAQHRLGNAREAASWLEKAVQASDGPSPGTARGPGSDSWNRRLTLRLLRREAEGLLEKKSQ
jgi:tetratricopeptide (TPR) repeat protein